MMQEIWNRQKYRFYFSKELTHAHTQTLWNQLISRCCLFDERYTRCWTAPKQLRIKVWGQYNINNIGNLIQAIAQLVMKFCGIWIVLYLGLSLVRGKPTQGKIKEQETFNIFRWFDTTFIFILLQQIQVKMSKPEYPNGRFPHSTSSCQFVKEISSQYVV